MVVATERHTAYLLTHFAERDLSQPSRLSSLAMEHHYKRQTTEQEGACAWSSLRASAAYTRYHVDDYDDNSQKITRSTVLCNAVW